MTPPERAGSTGLPSWQARSAVAIGSRVKEVRQQAGRGVQVVANYCTNELGFKTLRTTLANLETGTRKSVTIGEITVLAEALKVSPMVLLFPPDAHENEEAGAVEYLPGQHAAPLEAWRRFTAPLFDMLGSPTGSAYEADPVRITAETLAAFARLESSWNTCQDLKDSSFNTALSLQMRSALQTELSQLVSNSVNSLMYLQEFGAVIDGLLDEEWLKVLEDKIEWVEGDDD